jgi:hypothetical protein
MNRSILIVICDFLLVSLLAFSTVDINKIAQPGAPRLMQSTAPSKQMTGRQDLGDVMRLALDEERRNRDRLLGDLSRTQAAVSQREEQIRNVQGQLQSKAEQAARLQAEQKDLQRQFFAAQTNVESLNQQLRASAVENVITKEERAAMEAEARKQTEKSKALEQELARMRDSNQTLSADRQSLDNQLQLSQAANRAALAQMAQLQEEVDAQRRENVRLTEGVKALAVKSSELAQEIRDNRPMTPNMIFEELTTNRVMARFTGMKAGLFGLDSNKEKQTQTIVITDGTNDCALCHVQDTPLTLWNPGTQWQELTGTLTRNGSGFAIQSISFSVTDPRVVLIPLPAAEARALGCKVYRVSNDPYKFQDAVVVGTRADYYGECKFQIDLTTPQYLKMDHNSLKGLFGKFNPSSGDLVLSKNGELLGVMANGSYCVQIRGFEPAATFRFGPESRNQPTAQTLSTLYTVVSDLPFKLQ